MKKTYIIAICLFIMFTGLAEVQSRGRGSGDKSGLFMEAVSFVEKGKRVRGKLCVIPFKDKEGVPGSRWMLLRSDSYFARDLGDVNPGFAIVNNVKASADSRFLAVETVGEGQTAIHIIDLQKLLEGGKAESLIEIGAHPGHSNISRWKGRYLLITSDILLSKKEKNVVTARHSNLILNKSESYYLDMRTQKIFPHNRLLNTPVTYYIRQLRHRNPSVRLTAAVALQTLNAKNALPYIKRALRTERNARTRQGMGEVIRFLEG